MTEHEIQTAIINYLKEREDIYFWRNNVGRKKNMFFGLKGSGDLLGVIKPSGKFLSIEIKNETGKTSEEQDNFIKKINDMGGVAFVARDLKTVIDKLQLVNAI